MNRWTRCFGGAACGLLLAGSLPVRADDGPAAIVESATQVLQEIAEIPEQAIPPSLLNKAHGLAIIPNLFKAGLIVGGKHGRGILVVRGADGAWSDPVVVSLSGGSIGWQIGAQSSDVILVIRTMRSVNAMTAGKFTLGADASVAAGPVGRQASAGTDIEFKAEVYSYSRSRGLFAGLALDGSVLGIDHDGNADFYGRDEVTPGEVFAGKGGRVPAVVAGLKKALADCAAAEEP